MFSPNLKNDPLLSAIKDVMAENDKHREAVDRANKHFKVTDKKQLPHNLHAYYEKMITESAVISEKITKSTPMGKVIADFEKSDAPQFEGKSKEKRREMAIAAKMAMDESLKGNQQKIDANKNGKVDAQDFKMLRKDMTAEEVMKEAIANLLEKDSLSEAEQNILMELDVTDTEVMNSDLYKNAVKSLGGKDPRKIQIGQEVEGLGKFEKGDNIFNKVRATLAAQKIAPTRSVEPTNVKQVVPGATPAVSPLGPGAKYSDLNKFKSASQFNDTQKRMQPQRDPTVPPVSVGPTPNYPTADQVRPDVPKNTYGQDVPLGYSMVAGQKVRNDNTSQLPTQVTQPSTVRGYGNDSLSTTIKSMYADRIRR